MRRRVVVCDIAARGGCAARDLGARSREYLWIRGRTPTLPAPVLQDFRRIAAAAGFDVNLLVNR